MLRYPKVTFTALLILFAALAVALANGSDFSDWDILTTVRLPRVMTALGAGAAVSIAGVLSQALFRNALAAPSILGTEAGAGFGLAVCVAFFGVHADQNLVMVSAFLGAAVATSMVLKLASGQQPIARLLLGGFALNALLSAGTAIITSWLLESGQGIAIYHWMLGSFSSRTWNQAAMILAAVVIIGVAALKLAGRLDLLALGEDGAATSGIRISALRKTTFLLIAALIGTSMTVGGALPFVGLIVPHFMRIQTGPNIKALILNSGIAGAALVVIADLAARNLRAPVEMDVGLLTTLIGAPYFLWLLKRETNS